MEFKFTLPWIFRQWRSVQLHCLHLHRLRCVECRLKWLRSKQTRRRTKMIMAKINTITKTEKPIYTKGLGMSTLMVASLKRLRYSRRNSWWPCITLKRLVVETFLWLTKNWWTIFLAMSWYPFTEKRGNPIYNLSAASFKVPTRSLHFIEFAAPIIDIWLSNTMMCFVGPVFPSKVAKGVTWNYPGQTHSRSRWTWDVSLPRRSHLLDHLPALVGVLGCSERYPLTLCYVVLTFLTVDAWWRYRRGSSLFEVVVHGHVVVRQQSDYDWVWPRLVLPRSHSGRQLYLNLVQ